MKKSLAILLTVCILLNAQGFSSCAKEEFFGNDLPNTVSENNIRKDDRTVSENSAPNKMASENDVQEEKTSENNTPDETVSENSVPQNNIPENSISENSLFSMGRAAGEGALSDEILKRHTVKGMNPEQAVVTLFDYWKDDDPAKSRDEGRFSSQEYLTGGHDYAHGISKYHMLIFGKFDGFGPWNTSWGNVATDTSAVGMVKNKLEDGCPVLNLDAERWKAEDYPETKDGTYFYKFDSSHLDAGGVNHYEFPADFLMPDETGKVKAKEESLAYLFSPDYIDSTKKDDYREIYRDVRGLFQQDADGYYYYDSRKNFAEYDQDSNSFILYDSPGGGGG